MKYKFPLYDSHEHVDCFRCKADLKSAIAVQSGYARGSGFWAKNCPNCGMSTFYDLAARPT